MPEGTERRAAERRFLRRAVELAAENVQSGKGGPFGAVIVSGGRILAEGTNLVTWAEDPTAHAEIVAIRRACRRRRRFHLQGCEIYTSCEPCPMCLGAIYWARLDRIYYAASREDAAAAGFQDADLYRELGLAIEERRIPMVQMMRAEGRKAFRAWKDSVTKVEY